MELGKTVDDMNMNNGEGDWINVTNKIKVKAYHPCQYCGNKCYGLQCKECHLKMVSKRNSDCIDCKKSFIALKKDGTKRKRCFDCQEKYTQKYYKNCPECNFTFKYLLSNGKTFEKCIFCYEKEKEENKKKIIMNDCKKCKAKTQYELCNNCFKDKKEIETTYMVSKCAKCSQRFKGIFKYCKNCKV